MMNHFIDILCLMLIEVDMEGFAANIIFSSVRMLKQLKRHLLEDLLRSMPIVGFTVSI